MRSHMVEAATEGSTGGGVRSNDDLLRQPQQHPAHEEPVFHARTKHNEVHYHFLRERVLFGEVELQYVPTVWQTANIFTKPLGLDK